MKKTVEILLTITGAILSGTFVAGMLTLGRVFYFENYNTFNWILLSIYYVFWITLFLKLIVYED